MAAGIRVGRRHVRLTRGGRPSLAATAVAPVLAVAVALLLGLVALSVTGFAPGAVLVQLLQGAFGGQRQIAGTLLEATPLLLTGLAAAIAFRMNLWNIGAEGQLQVGAIVAAGVAIVVADPLPAVLAVPLLLLSGIVGGALWALLAALPRALVNANEILLTLMLNFVALNIMQHLVYGSRSLWVDPAFPAFPRGQSIPGSAHLPVLGAPVRSGLLLAVAVAVLLWVLVRWTRFGIDLRMIGASEQAATYAGVRVGAMQVAVLVLSGALAGLAGAIEIGGRADYALDPRALVGLGFTGIVIAAVARLNPLAVIPVAVLVGALANATTRLQVTGVPVAVVEMMTAFLLLAAITVELFLRYRIRIAPVPAPGDGRVDMQPQP